MLDTVQFAFSPRSGLGNHLLTPYNISNWSGGITNWLLFRRDWCGLLADELNQRASPPSPPPFWVTPPSCGRCKNTPKLWLTSLSICFLNDGDNVYFSLLWNKNDCAGGPVVANIAQWSARCIIYCLTLASADPESGCCNRKLTDYGCDVECHLSVRRLSCLWWREQHPLHLPSILCLLPPASPTPHTHSPGHVHRLGKASHSLLPSSRWC